MSRLYSDSGSETLELGSFKLTASSGFVYVNGQKAVTNRGQSCNQGVSPSSVFLTKDSGNTYQAYVCSPSVARTCFMCDSLTGCDPCNASCVDYCQGNYSDCHDSFNCPADWENCCNDGCTSTCVGTCYDHHGCSGCHTHTCWTECFDCRASCNASCYSCNNCNDSCRGCDTCNLGYS